MFSAAKSALVFMVLFCNQPFECSKLNLPRVLLPIFKSVSVEFVLEVTGGGCYRWSASRLDIIRLTILNPDPVYGCSNRAVVASITNDLTRNTAIILAEDMNSGFVIRTDVIVDTISSLSIVTTTRELYLEEAPELFEVRAYDVQGNEFTTLEGVEFRWNLRGNAKLGEVLRFMPLEDAPYETPDSLNALNVLGKQGNIIFIEGMRTGMAKVSVDLPYSEYSHIPFTEVQLMVVTNVIIEPAVTHIIVTDTIQYRILQVKRGRFIELPFPSTEYYLESEDTSIAIVNGNEVTGLRVGRVKLVLKDVNRSLALQNENIQPPCAFLTVAIPYKLSLTILPGNNWALDSSREATFMTQVFCRDNNRFLLGKNVNINIDIPTSLFVITSLSINGSVVSGYGHKPGIGKVKASLNLAKILPMDMIGGKETLDAVETLAIYPKLSLSPEVVVFPWNYYQLKRNKIIMIPNGGDGNYIWTSSNTSVAFVYSNGNVLVNDLGTTTITLSMKCNQDIQVKATVHVVKPIEMKLLYNLWEGEIGQPVYLNVALFGITLIGGNAVKVPFTQCDFLEFNIKMDEGFYHDEALSGKPQWLACATFAVVGRIQSSSQVNISFLTEDSILKTSAKVTFYEGITTFYPTSTKPIVLAVGSSMNTVFTCGPQLALTQNIFYVVTEPNTLEYYEVSRGTDNLIYNVKCLKYGQADFSFYTYYSLDDNFLNYPVYSSRSISFICAVPREMSLSSEMGPNCLNFGSYQVWAPLHGKYQVNLMVKDENGLPFDNATSLKFRWKVNNYRLLDFDDQGKVNLEMVCNTSIWRHYKLFNLKNTTGSVTIQVKIKGGYNIPPSLLVVKIVGPPVVEPNSVSMFNHPKSKQKLMISYGTNYFNIQLNPKGIANLEYERYSQTLTLVPQRDGLGELSVTDLCVPYPPTFVNIKIINIDNININIISTIEVGQKVLAVVQFFDGENKPISLPEGIEHDSYHSILIGVQGIIDIISVRSSETERMNGIINYSVVGTRLGDTTLQVKFHGVVSKVIHIQVFSPIRLYPRILTLITGAEVQVTVLGGPSSNSVLQFKIGDLHIASFSSGFVKGLHSGRTTLTAIAKSHLSEVLSKDSIEIHVEHINGVRIQVPITRLCVGCTMPAWAVGIPSSLTPLVLGSTTPPLQFRWSVSPPGIIRLQDVLADVGVEINDEDRLSMHIHGLKPGNVAVYLSLSSRSERTILFNSSLQMEVIDKLAWLHPERTGEILLIAPNSQTQLFTNKEGVDISTYQLANTFISQNEHPVMNQGKNQSFESHDVVTVSSSGFLTTSSVLGSAIIIARTSSSDYKLFQQTIGLIVEVKPVSYLMINVATRLKTGQKLRGLPRGLLLLLNITYHDSVGAVFYANPLSVQLHANRFDRVNILRESTNTSIRLSLESAGSVTFHLYDDFQQLEEYMKLSIVNEISPERESMSLGEAVCFQVPISGSEGLWASDSDNIIFHNNGLATALKLGTANIIYSYSKPTSNIQMSTTIDVLPVNNVQFELSEDLIITNAYSSMNFNIPFSIRNEKNKQEALATFISACPNMVHVLKKYPFTCEIGFSNSINALQINELFNVFETFDSNTGLYACKLDCLAEPSNITSIIRSNITVKVLYHQSYSDIRVLKFYPAIYLRATSLIFSRINAPAKLGIMGVPEVLNGINILTSDPEVLTISEPYYTDKFHLNYPVHLAQGYWSQPERHGNLSLTVISKLTEQKIKVTIMTLFKECNNSNIPCVVFGVDHWLSNISKLYASWSESKYVGLILTFTLGSILFFYFCIRRMTRNMDRLHEQYYFVRGGDDFSSSDSSVRRSISPFRNSSPVFRRNIQR